MTNIINAKRINQITTFLKSLNIKSKRFSEIIRTQNISVIQDFNQVFIHSSEEWINAWLMSWIIEIFWVLIISENLFDLIFKDFKKVVIWLILFVLIIFVIWFK